MKSIVFTFIIVGISSTNAEVTWPSGVYGLPKAKTGCPKSDGMKWEEGWRKQDMEDDKVWGSEISSNFHMEANIWGLQKDINRTFCMKPEIGISKREWPRGFYCVYKGKDYSCPKGMKEGSVTWDDENSRNNNRKKGTLPDGTYDENTMIKYCCQDEGHWYNAVQLPVDRPFYLLPHNSASFKNPKCQLVKWAMSWLEYIRYDTNDWKNSDELKGSHVFVHSGESLLTMYYCYYKGCGSNIYRENNGTFTSRNDHAQFQYCSWLVTVRKNRLILLYFVNLNVPNCNENFVKIYGGVNDKARLVKTYCGLNATSGSTIVSSTNNLFVVLKSGTYSKDTGIVVGFGAKYSTQLKSTKSCNVRTTYGECCIFPFTYKGIKYYHCITVGNENTPWCYYKSRWGTKWGNCKEESTATMPMSFPTTTIVTTTKLSTFRSSPQSESNKESSHDLLVTYIIVPVIVGVTIILVITIIVLCIRRRRSKHSNNENDDDYVDVEPGETVEAMPRVIPGSFNTPGEVSHANAADKEDTDGYVVPFQETSGETPSSQQHYQSLDVLRREDEENKYQSLVRMERSSDYVNMPDGTYMELNSNRENGDALYTSLQSEM